MLRTFKGYMAEANQEALQQASTHSRRVIDVAKEAYWNDFCSGEIRNTGDEAKVWEKLKTMCCSTHPMEGPLTINGGPTTSAKEKAEILADTFSQVSQSAHLPSNERQLRLEKEAEFDLRTREMTTQLP